MCHVKIFDKYGSVLILCVDDASCKHPPEYRPLENVAISLHFHSIGC